jgi:S1-C subfamily serine protease
VTLKARDTKATSVAENESKEKDENAVSDAQNSVKFEKLGMTVRPLTSEEKRDYSLDRGVVVSDVKQYSEAYNRFLRPNYVILEADRRDVRSPGDLKKIIDSRKPGDSILLRVRQEDKRVTFVAVQIPK